MYAWFKIHILCELNKRKIKLNWGLWGGQRLVTATKLILMAARGGRGDRHPPPPPTHYYYHVYDHDQFHNRAPKNRKKLFTKYWNCRRQKLRIKKKTSTNFDPKMITSFHIQKAKSKYQFSSIPLNLFDCLRQINFGVYWACCVSEWGGMSVKIN